MKKILFFFGSLLIFCSGGFALAVDFDGEQNLYRHVYTELQEKPQKMAIERVSGQLGVSAREMQQLLGNPSQRLVSSLPFCGADILNCVAIVRTMFAEEYRMAAYEVTLNEELSAGDRWANGTLADSSFDIVVDLNVIDVILFGQEATVPAARVSGGVQRRHIRTVGDLVSALTRTPPAQRPGGSGGTDPENPLFPTPGTPGGPSGPVCRDPEALFLAAPVNGGSSGAASGPTDDAAGGNSSARGEQLPDLTNDSDQNRRGNFPELLAPKADEACSEDEVPVFNGLFCLPNFCEDAICVFTELKPGRAFSLAPQETHTCVNCVVKKGVEVLSTLEKMVEAPQDATNKRYSVRKFLSLFGLGKMQFTAIPKALPFLHYDDPTPAAKTADEQAKARGQKIAAQNTTLDAESLQNPVGANGNGSKNELLRSALATSDCASVLSLFPVNAEVLTEELLTLCTQNDSARQKRSLDTLIQTAAGAASQREYEAMLTQRKEFVKEIDDGLRVFQNDLGDFTSQILSTLQPQDIRAIAECRERS